VRKIISETAYERNCFFQYTVFLKEHYKLTLKLTCILRTILGEIYQWVAVSLRFSSFEIEKATTPNKLMWAGGKSMQGGGGTEEAREGALLVGVRWMYSF
jgi:hypothetical protein